MPGPLYGKRILLTREQAPSETMARHIQDLDGEAVILPVMKIVQSDLTQEEVKTIQHTEQFDWVILTSASGVRTFMKNIELLDVTLSNVKIAAVGKKTAQVIRDYGLSVERVPDEFTAEGLASLFVKNADEGTSVLLPLGQLAKPHLETELQKAGFLVKRINVYQTVPNEEVQADLIKLVEDRNVDVVTFASPSAVDFFLKMTAQVDLSDFWEHTMVACIGKVSAAFARSQGLVPRIVPDTFTADNLVEAIAEYYSAS